jgi:MFS family permease
VEENSILLIISAISFLPDSETPPDLSLYFHNLRNGNSPFRPSTTRLLAVKFMIGAGGLVVVTLSAYFGRLPVLFYFLTLVVGTTAWCSAAMNFGSFMTTRILNGFFSTVAQAGGLMWIKDLYFPREHARKINV